VKKKINCNLIYRHKNKTIKGSIKTDGHTLYVTLAGVEFEGVDFESLEPTNGSVSSDMFEYTSQFSELTNFSMEFTLPLAVNVEGEEKIEPLECNIVTKENELTKIDLTLGAFEVKGCEEFETALIHLQKKLPKTDTIKSCLSCRYSHYHPCGSGIFGSIYCFIKLKEEALNIADKVELMNLWTSERVEEKLIFNTQETFVCDRHKFVKENDWVYKDWIVNEII